MYSYLNFFLKKKTIIYTLPCICEDQTPPVCPAKVRRHFPVVAFQTCVKNLCKLVDMTIV